MSAIKVLVKRNIKLFFKDKGLFLVSLITPMILLVLYITFLGNVYRDSFLMMVPQGFSLDDRVIDGFIASQLVSSMLAVSCITVGFCSNMLMVQDKATGTIKDLSISPVRPYSLAVSYFVANLFSTLIICYSALAIGLAYIAIVGWYMTALDVLMLMLDVLLLVLFGGALSSVINFFLSSQGQMSAVGTMVSSCYGFMSGAYMPISQFPEGLQKVIMFLPGTYGTVLLRNHAMRGAFAQMAADGLSSEVIELAKNSMDINVYFFENKVEIWNMYLVLGGAVVVLLGAYVLLNIFKSKKVKV